MKGFRSGSPVPFFSSIPSHSMKWNGFRSGIVLICADRFYGGDGGGDNIILN